MFNGHLYKNAASHKSLKIQAYSIKKPRTLVKRKFYVTGGPLEITGEAGGGGGANSPKKIDARVTRLKRKILQAVAPKKKFMQRPEKKSFR